MRAVISLLYGAARAADNRIDIMLLDEFIKIKIWSILMRL